MIMIQGSGHLPQSHTKVMIFFYFTLFFWLIDIKQHKFLVIITHGILYSWPPWQHQVERSLVCVEGWGRISQSGLTQDIKMGSCVFQCDVPHQWIAQRQAVSVYCDGVGCHVLCLRHGISVWQHIGQSTTATSRHRRDMTSDVSKRR